jgi:putative ubiquitin-RnfH superfamily antitoxin RatB of RatAB toxin-antitoxin module
MSAGVCVEIACALPYRQRLIALRVETGCTAREAVRRSGIAADFPELDVESAPLGIWGRVLKEPATEPLRGGDRVEIYRPLQIDPKVVRQARAAARQIRSRR